LFFGTNVAEIVWSLPAVNEKRWTAPGEAKLSSTEPGSFSGPRTRVLASTSSTVSV
jgi:hypothetical protein